MSSSTAFHFDASVIGPRVYIKPGYRTFRQQLEGVQSRCGESARLAADKPVQSVEVPAPVQQRCVLVVRTACPPPAPTPQPPQQHIGGYVQLLPQPPQQPDCVAACPMSPPAGMLPPSPTPSDEARYSQMHADHVHPDHVHPDHVHPDHVHPDHVHPDHVHLGHVSPVHQPRPDEWCTAQSAHLCPDGSVRAGPRRDGDGESSFAVSCEHDTESTRSPTDTSDYQCDGSDAESARPLRQQRKPASEAALGLSVPRELLHTLAGVRILQPCKVVLPSLAEEHASTERLEEVASQYGHLESCYVRASSEPGMFTGVLVFKDSTFANAFRGALCSGCLSPTFGTDSAVVGTTKYCPRFLKGGRCRDSCCPYVHSLVDTEAYAL
eukprot:TRINITY_DN1095_c0_g1_i1.p1 TRINITY_DN1095_c0_g1~~TRINITY_DN1095_c0_g1_i1.p1  ORF type:complete len:380 (+),score=109.71 TRINITY_DN1095_c0_g1_i1:91-1230(+)